MLRAADSTPTPCEDSSPAGYAQAHDASTRAPRRPALRRFDALPILLAAAALLACGKLRGNNSASSATPSPPAAPLPTVAAAPAAADVAFTGTYTKYAATTFRNGKPIRVSNTQGSATVAIGGGKVTFGQTYPSNGKIEHVTQIYTYRADDARPVTGGFDLPLVFQSMEGDTKNYSPDKNNPKIQARKQASGWEIGLLTTDNNGVSGGMEFK